MRTFIVIAALGFASASCADGGTPCTDGTVSQSKGSGTCAHHGGIAPPSSALSSYVRWLLASGIGMALGFFLLRAALRRRRHASPPDAVSERVALRKRSQAVMRGDADLDGRPPQEQPEASGPPPLPGRIKILYLAANPTSMNQLDLTREARKIEERIGVGRPRDGIELVPRWAVRPRDLHRALLEEEPHILHFGCHGSPREQLLLEDDNGATARVEKEALTDLIGHLPGNLRLVVLNACDTEQMAEALVRHVDCAIGMHEPIGEEAAIAFAASFYQALGFGKSVETAFRLGKNELKLARMPEDQTPQLKVKAGIDAAKLILVRSR